MTHSTNPFAGPVQPTVVYLPAVLPSTDICKLDRRVLDPATVTAAILHGCTHAVRHRLRHSGAAQRAVWFGWFNGATTMTVPDNGQRYVTVTRLVTWAYAPNGELVIEDDHTWIEVGSLLTELLP